jgi:subtilisin family serine protease
MADKLGADIINSSLGYFHFNNPNYNYSYTNMDGNTAFSSRGANIAFSRGMIVVVSAGNSGNTANPNISAPSDATFALAVGAVDSARNYASFSSIGPSYDGRVKPDAMAQGQFSVVAMPSGNVASNSGTSFSGPIIAGMIASFWQAFPNLTNTRIVQLVKESADRFTNPNTQYGYGIPNFQLALNNALENNQYNSEGYTVYPNPVNMEVIFSFASNKISREISIYNSLGQEILNCNASNQLQLISMQSCENGLYFYKIASGNDTFTGKLIKK